MDWIILLVDTAQVNIDDLLRFRNEKVTIVRLRRMPFIRREPIQVISAQGSREMSLEEIRALLAEAHGEAEPPVQPPLATRWPDDPTDAHLVNRKDSV